MQMLTIIVTLFLYHVIISCIKIVAFSFVSVEPNMMFNLHFILPKSSVRDFHITVCHLCISSI